jgi:hypothetical protein
MALTDTKIKRAKRKEKAYGMRDGCELYLWITPAGGNCGVGSTAIRPRKNSCPSVRHRVHAGGKHFAPFDAIGESSLLSS